jgi:hypothetical protein
VLGDNAIVHHISFWLERKANAKGHGRALNYAEAKASEYFLRHFFPDVRSRTGEVGGSPMGKASKLHFFDVNGASSPIVAIASLSFCPANAI